MRRSWWLGALLLATNARAGVVHFPGAGTWGTLLAEDEWPCQGDLDFNDAVVRYNVRRSTTGTDTTSIALTLEVDAVGATKCSGLGWRLPIPLASIASVTRHVGDPSTASGAPWADGEALTGADLTESGGQAVIWLVDSLRDDLCGGATGFLNTDPALGLTECAPVTFDVQLTGPTALAATEPWDLFLAGCDDRTHQIHRPAYDGLPAGDPFAADAAEFGTCADASGGGTFYVTGGGLPFVLLLGEGNGTLGTGPAPYPEERARIDAAMPRILELADGTGDGDPGWDFHTAGTVAALLFDGTRPTLVATSAAAFDGDGDRACLGFDHDGAPGTPATCLWGAVPDDCDDLDPGRGPTVTDPFGDGLDADCDLADGFDGDGDGNASIASGGSDCDDGDALVALGTPDCPAVSCKDLLARYPATYEQDGAYTIKPFATAAFSAWCDMTTAGGGWTMLTNPVEMGTAEFPGLVKSTPSVSGQFNCPTTWSPSITSFGEYALRNYSCGDATVTWRLSLPNAFGARDVMFVATLQGQNQRSWTINGTALSANAVTLAGHRCDWFNATGTTASLPTNGCHEKYLDVAPRVQTNILPGTGGFTLDARSGAACSPDCQHGTGSHVMRLGVR